MREFIDQRRLCARNLVNVLAVLIARRSGDASCGALDGEENEEQIEDVKGLMALAESYGGERASETFKASRHWRRNKLKELGSFI
jgi:hypothetical protein